MAQVVERLSDFGSDHDLVLCEFEPCVGLCAGSSEPGAASDRKSTRLNSSHLRRSRMPSSA